MNIVIVESPAKARTINRYLGQDYKVLASFGHVRDLPSKDGSVKPDQDFAMTWEVDGKSKRHINDIAKALKGAERLYLATDPDREGEAISWHIAEVLKKRRALENVEVRRVVFHEITKGAILEAMANPRDLNYELIEAYLARRALDYLVGFTLSPVLWRKLPGSRSAGRVQSVALRLICERESEIEAFKPREYWSVEGSFGTRSDSVFPARLTHLRGEKLGKFAISDEAAARDATETARRGNFAVTAVERKTVLRNPHPPFTTSTLQQEASRKLRFGASRTMRVAQTLYEGVNLGGEIHGLITYMRTDSVVLSGEAVAGCRKLIAGRFGDDYLPGVPRVYKTSAKNAQEAHEAIRPTDVSRKPKDVAGFLDDDQRRLYELIWKRAVASQMASARLEQVAIDIASGGPSGECEAAFRATGAVVLFDGFLKLYQESRDDAGEEDEGERILPGVTEGEPVTIREVTPEQHFTQPPPRYTEASLVKKLEELGIGRPSTYASIIDVLQDRNYVRLEKRRFEPEDRGRLVTAFLENFFNRYVQYNFTADLENRLDDISSGRIDWRAVLKDFWSAFIQAVDETKELTIRQVIDALDAELGPHFFPETPDGANPRLCPTCKDGRLGLRFGKYGAFIGCSNYPDCAFTRRLTIAGNGPGMEAGEDNRDESNGPRILGTDPASGMEVSLRKGPYGPYVQLGEAAKGKKPKRTSLPKNLPPEDVSLEAALGLLSLPREIGPHPETGKPITAGIGRYGPYVQHDGAYIGLESEDDVLTVGINRAVDLVARAKKRGKGGVSGRTLGSHPADGKPVTLHKGRYGPYVAHGRLRASLGKKLSEDSVTLEKAISLLDAKSAKGGAGKKKSGGKPAMANAGGKSDR